VIAYSWGIVGLEMIVAGCRVFLWGTENVLQLVEVMVVQPCEYTKSHPVAHFE
jgi:hypothetical protein